MPKGQISIIDEEYVFNTLGVRISDYVYYKSLMGDRADNISGIPSIGPIRAKRIVTKEIPFDLSDYQDLLKRNISLITLNSDVKLDIDLTDLKYCGGLTKANRVLFSECEL